MPSRYAQHRQKWAVMVAAVFLVFALAGYAALFASIHGDVSNTASEAMTRYPGDRVEALTALVDCEDCALRDRNRAVWALGQLRDARALPVLEKRLTGRECDHSASLCQHELRKAIAAIRSHSTFWLGYRDWAAR